MDGPATCTNEHSSFVYTEELLLLYNCLNRLQSLLLRCGMGFFEIIDFLFPLQLLIVSPVASVAAIAGGEGFCCVLLSTVKTVFCDFEVAAHMTANVC